MPTWAPDGSRIAYLGNYLSGANAVFVVPATEGPTTNVTAQLDRYVMGFQWLRDAKSILVSYVDGVSWPIVDVDVASGKVRPIGEDTSAVRLWPTTAVSGVAAWLESDATTPAVIRVLTLNANSSRILIDLNPQVRSLDLGTQEVVRWRNDRGDELEGVLLKPLGYQEGQRYPLIVDAYPGQPNAFKGFAMEGSQAWAAEGYAVFWPNARGPHVWENPFKSQTYNQAAKGPRGWDVTVDDVMSGVDALTRRGIADPSRLGLYGFSNGGAIVNYLVTRTDRFKCAVSVSGLSDWISLPLLTGDPGGVMESLEGGGNPWENTDDYVQVSAVFHVKDVRTPMLLAAGDEEGGFLLNTIEMYSGLRRFGKDVTFLRYPGQGHGFTGPALEDFTNREMQFLANCLHPTTPPN